MLTQVDSKTNSIFMSQETTILYSCGLNSSMKQSENKNTHKKIKYALALWNKYTKRNGVCDRKHAWKLVLADTNDNVNKPRFKQSRLIPITFTKQSQNLLLKKHIKQTRRFNKLTAIAFEGVSKDSEHRRWSLNMDSQVLCTMIFSNWLRLLLPRLHCNHRFQNKIQMLTV